MGRLDLPDKEVDWVCVTKEYLHELYADVKDLKADNERLVEVNRRLRGELARTPAPRTYL